jgi:hypothetical protein
VQVFLLLQVFAFEEVRALDGRGELSPAATFVATQALAALQLVLATHLFGITHPGVFAPLFAALAVVPVVAASVPRSHNA